MLENPALLRAILVSLDDDLPRLVYADWLEERGQPERAEFIRLQCEMARFPDDPRQGQWRQREHAIFDRHRWFPSLLSWKGDLVVGPVEHRPTSVLAVVRRGFIDELRGSIGNLLKYGWPSRHRELLRVAHVTDRQPRRGKWWLERPGQESDMSDLPRNVFERLSRGRLRSEYETESREYRNEQQAFEDLSDAVLQVIC